MHKVARILLISLRWGPLGVGQTERWSQEVLLWMVSQSLMLLPFLFSIYITGWGHLLTKVWYHQYINKSQSWVSQLILSKSCLNVWRLDRSEWGAIDFGSILNRYSRCGCLDLLSLEQFHLCSWMWLHCLPQDWYATVMAEKSFDISICVPNGLIPRPSELIISWLNYELNWTELNTACPYVTSAPWAVLFASKFPCIIWNSGLKKTLIEKDLFILRTACLL